MVKKKTMHHPESPHNPYHKLCVHLCLLVAVATTWQRQQLLALFVEKQSALVDFTDVQAPRRKLLKAQPIE